MTTTPTVLVLTDGITYDTTSTLSEGTEGPTVYSVTAHSDRNPEPQAIIGTADQLLALQSVLTAALVDIHDTRRRHTMRAVL